MNVHQEACPRAVAAVQMLCSRGIRRAQFMAEINAAHGSSSDRKRHLQLGVEVCGVLQGLVSRQDGPDAAITKCDPLDHERSDFVVGNDRCHSEPAGLVRNLRNIGCDRGRLSASGDLHHPVCSVSCPDRRNRRDDRHDVVENPLFHPFNLARLEPFLKDEGAA